MWDVILGAGSIALIVLLVLLTSAKILYPQGSLFLKSTT